MATNTWHSIIDKNGSYKVDSSLLAVDTRPPLHNHNIVQALQPCTGQSQALKGQSNGSSGGNSQTLAVQNTSSSPSSSSTSSSPSYSMTQHRFQCLDREKSLFLAKNHLHSLREPRTAAAPLEVASWAASSLSLVPRAAANHMGVHRNRSGTTHQRYRHSHQSNYRAERFKAIKKQTNSPSYRVREKLSIWCRKYVQTGFSVCMLLCAGWQSGDQHCSSDTTHHLAACATNSCWWLPLEARR